MDELDWVCHPMRSELNFPIGLRKALDFTTRDNAQGRRWEIPIHLWDALFSAPAQTPPKELRHNKEAHELLCRLNITMKKGYDRNALQARPTHKTRLAPHFSAQPPHARPCCLCSCANSGGRTRSSSTPTSTAPRCCRSSPTG